MYFKNQLPLLKLYNNTKSEKTLRNAQLGAIFAIGSHFSLHDKQSIISMPTGSGKTAVIVVTPYILEAKRVLVLTSSVLVRGQIFEEFNKLKTVKEIGVFDDNVLSPNSFEIIKKIESEPEFTKLEKYDVVVSIPVNLSFFLENISKSDLFDLIIVDEAHHEAAEKWSLVLDKFPKAKKVLFTATPFRRDKKEIRGAMIYSYPLSKAVSDGIFGKIEYHPVKKQTGNKDVDIALFAELVFKQDRKAGFEHVLMVRTNSKVHAQELLKIYETKTELRLKAVNSNHTYRYIQSTIRELREGKLDGIICVDMMGEGFDFPKLKIAAIHSPHKSLAVTLQFIGRFARTNDPRVGVAKFIAVPDEQIQLEKISLYKEGNVWNDLIIDLSEGRIEKDRKSKEFIETFNDYSFYESDSVSLWNLRPYTHIKIYRVKSFYIENVLELDSHTIKNHFVSEEYKSVVFITRESKLPKWMKSNDLMDVKHYIFIIHYNAKHGLLFIHSSIRTPQFYNKLASDFTEIEFWKAHQFLIPKIELHKVLLDIQEVKCYNVGLQNRIISNGESYKILSGPKADNVISDSDVKTHSAGHLMFTGEGEEKKITLGYSSGSKVWQNSYLMLPDFVEFCDSVGAKIQSNRKVVTNSKIDNIPIGENVSKISGKPFLITWNNQIYQDLPKISFIGINGQNVSGDITSIEVKIVNFDKERNEIRLLLSIYDSEFIVTYTVNEEGELYSIDNEERFNFLITFDEYEDISYNSLVDYLNEYPFSILFTDLSTIANHEYFKPLEPNKLYFDTSNLIPLDWSDTDIELEFHIDESPNKTPKSVQGKLWSYLLTSDFDAIVYDHGSGEIADFITFKSSSNTVKIQLFHVKASGGPKVGNRVGDIYEVCGQSVKSLIFLQSNGVFLEKIKQRITDKPNKLIHGTANHVLNLLSNNDVLQFEIIAVQPGISKMNLETKQTYIFAATHDFINNSGIQSEFCIYCS